MRIDMTYVKARWIVLASLACAAASVAQAEGLPSGVPPAALVPEPALPAPAGWPFGEAFPRTSGAGRYAGGAFFWSDFLYDDAGAVGSPDPAENVQTIGNYVYPDPNQAGNGADIFRVAIGRTATDTWWRVDWNTLVSASQPIAMFVVDTDGQTSTGGALWPANTGLSSAGIERALLISSAGAWLIDATSVLPMLQPVATLGGAHSVDLDARSFVVRLPHAALAPSGVDTVRCAAGLANASGDGFLTLGSGHHHLDGQPNVYNVTFREILVDEASMTTNDSNLFFERQQALALTGGGNVDPFAVPLDWERLAAADTEPEPLIKGYINMWHVSSHPLGQGVIALGPNFLGLEEFQYLGRVQPFAVYVPTTYDPNVPTPMTWNIHGASSFHNSTLGRSPELTLGMCEDRGNICLSPMGRGMTHGWDNEAELDFWEVWRAAASQFNLDPERTILSGISMGGFGSYRLGLANPEPFAAFGIMLGHAQSDIAAIGNARWHPIYHVHGNADELVPIQGALNTVAALDQRNYRYRFDRYDSETHTGFSQKDSWPGLIEWLGEQGPRTVDPGHVSYAWYHEDVREAQGFGPTGAWWVEDAVARDTAIRTASVDALSLAKPDPEITEVVRTTTPMPAGQPSPFTRTELEWVVGDRPCAEPRLLVDLDNVAKVTFELQHAGLVSQGAVTGDIDGDGILDGADNCPFAPNLDQADRGGIHEAAPDGIGDACQCGEVTGNGIVNGQDGVMIIRHGLEIEPNPLFQLCGNCDVNGDGACNGIDGFAVTREALGIQPNPVFADACPTFTGVKQIPVDTDGPSDVTLAELVPGTQVELDGVSVGSAGGDGRVLVSVVAGPPVVITLSP